MTLDITVAGELRGVRLYTDPKVEELFGKFNPNSLARITMSTYGEHNVELHLAPLVVPTQAREGEQSRWYGLDPAGYNAVAKELGTYTHMGNNPENITYFRHARIKIMPDGTKVCFPTEEMLKSFHVRERRGTG